MPTPTALVGRLLASPARAAMLELLLEGRAATAGELARAAAVAPSTASGHLAELVEGGLVRVRPQGRHRYYELADPSVAAALEAIGRLSPPRRPVRSLRESTRARALAHARTCYDHLAGRVGVGLLDRMLDQGWLTAAGDGYVVEEIGAQRLTSLGVDVEEAARRRRLFAVACLDWTERRPHLGGALGAVLLASLVDREWLVRHPSGRGLRVTPAGREGLARIGVPALDATG
jgi:DNA-binding transcriptional ArsR family regulator